MRPPKWGVSRAARGPRCGRLGRILGRRRLAGCCRALLAGGRLLLRLGRVLACAARARRKTWQAATPCDGRGDCLPAAPSRAWQSQTRLRRIRSRGHGQKDAGFPEAKNATSTTRRRLKECGPEPRSYDVPPPWERAPSPLQDRAEDPFSAQHGAERLTTVASRVAISRRGVHDRATPRGGGLQRKMHQQTRSLAAGPRHVNM